MLASSSELHCSLLGLRSGQTVQGQSCYFSASVTSGLEAGCFSTCPEQLATCGS